MPDLEVIPTTIKSGEVQKARKITEVSPGIFRVELTADDTNCDVVCVYPDIESGVAYVVPKQTRL